MATKIGTTRTSRLTPVDGDFQQQYLAAEKAYGTGNFEAAQSICENLLSQLKPLPEPGPEQEAMLAWQAFVALLMGHIQLYGMNDIEQAHYHYSLVLDSQPQKTLKELAEQGLERCQNEPQLETVEPEKLPEKPVAKQSAEQKQVALTTEPTEQLPAQICDPFLSPEISKVGVIKEGKQTQLDQQTTAQELVTLNTELSETLPELIRDPFLITTAPTTTIDQSTTKATLESATIKEKKRLPQRSEEPNHQQNTEIEQDDHPKQEPIATTPGPKLQPELNQEMQTEIRTKSELTPITKAKQNTENQAELSLQPISQAFADELLKDSLLRVIMPSIAGLAKHENTQLQSKKQASTTLKARLKNFWLVLSRR